MVFLVYGFPRKSMCSYLFIFIFLPILIIFATELPIKKKIYFVTKLKAQNSH